MFSHRVPVADEDNQGHAVAQLVRTRGGLGRIAAAELVEQPVAGRRQTLLVLSGSSHLDGVVVRLLSKSRLEEKFTIAKPGWNYACESAGLCASAKSSAC